MIRKMKISDLDRIMEIEEQSFRDDIWSRSQYLYELQENPYASLWVLTDKNGTIAGYYDLWTIFERAEIATIAIAPEYRKQGYGSLLMRDLLKRAKENECESISLEVRVSNTAAIRLYEHYEFVVVNVRKGYYKDADSYEDAYLMMRGI